MISSQEGRSPRPSSSAVGSKVNIVELLFERNLEHCVLRVFLALDGQTLKCARCVCRRWAKFISNEVWGRAQCHLERRLHNQWRFDMPRVLGVLSLARQLVWPPWQLDDDIFAFNIGLGKVKVMDLPRFSLGGMESINFRSRWTLECVGLSEVEAWRKEQKAWPAVHMALGPGILVTASLGQVTVWNKTTGAVDFKERLEEMEVTAVHVTSDGAVVVGGKGGVIVMAKDKQEEEKEGKRGWSVQYKLPTPGLEDMVRLGSSGNMVTLTTWGREGGGQAVTSLWDVNEGKQLPGSIAIQTGIDVIVVDPYIFSSGNTRFPGIKIWDMVSGRLVRHFQHPNLHQCHHIAVNGPFLVVNMFQENEGQTALTHTVAMFEHQELLAASDPSSVWFRVLHCSTFRPPFCYFPTNRTGILTASRDCIRLEDFWLAPSLDNKKDSREKTEGKRVSPMKKVAHSFAKISLAGLTSVLD